MCHSVLTAAKWYVMPPSIKEAYTTRMYLERGMKGATAEAPSPSEEGASGSRLFEEKRPTASGDGVRGAGYAAKGPNAPEAGGEKGLLVLLSDDDDDDDDDDGEGAEWEKVVPGLPTELSEEEEEEDDDGEAGEEEGHGLSASQELGGAATPEGHQLRESSTKPRSQYNLRGDKRKTLKMSEDWVC